MACYLPIKKRDRYPFGVRETTVSGRSEAALYERDLDLQDDVKYVLIPIGVEAGRYV